MVSRTSMKGYAHVFALVWISNCQLVSVDCLDYDLTCRPLRNILFQRATCSAIGACASGYIRVPCNPAVGTITDFCVAKYEMKNNSGAKSEAAGLPWVSITQTNAITECSNLGANFHLITNAEWMTIARNIETTAANWSTGTVNNGAISSGHNDNTPANALAASTDDTQGCTGTGQVCSNVTWDAQRRTSTLSNGETIWDFAGNVWEWNDWQVTQANKAYSSADGVPLAALREWTAIDTFPNALMIPSTWQPTNSALSSANGIGQYYAGNTDPGASLRGGSWTNGASAGAFRLDLNNGPASSAATIGFRCVQSN